MFVPETFAVAMVMMVTSTVCWGSWANTYKATKDYRFELFYWDYAIGIFLVSVLLAFTMGSTGGAGEGFLENVAAADRGNIGSAMIGGFIFNIANLLLVAGIEMAGLAVAFPVAIGIALVVGVVMSYAIQPVGDPALLGLGVVLAIVAVVLIGKAYGRLPTDGESVSRKSLIVCVVSGLLMGSFAPFVTRALTAGHALTPYSIAVFFTFGAFLCCFVVNVYFMKKPLVGTPVAFSGFFAARPKDHLLGVLGGFVWGTGTVFNFVAASLVGVAISYAVGQAAPMVAAAWGVFVWREFARADRQAKIYLALMFVCYLLALVAIAGAYQAA
ncbi:MAG: GRP family sugar transporter [Acidobacteriota bacterium]|nr:GRP family sugar transporter [Acidobacteriota bacterium]MDH3524483.1 GRP family sugar transporter [Acidobacteriota bacterium]